MVKIITDSTSDLDKNIIAEFGLSIIPLSVTITDRVYQDGVDIDQKDLFAMVKTGGELPKTSAPTIGEFIKAFDQPGEIIFIGISSKLSATIQNAILASQSFPTGKVRVIDSLNLSTGVGLLALRAAELRDLEYSSEQIETRLLSSVPKICTSFVIDTMEYLYMGGRCSSIQALFGSVLKIHPIIEVKPDGTLGVLGKVRGSLRKGHQSLLVDFSDHLPELDKKRVFVTHTCENDSDVEYLVEEVNRIASPEEVRATRAGSVISSHCGPGTAGILFFVK